MNVSPIFSRRVCVLTPDGLLYKVGTSPLILAYLLWMKRIFTKQCLPIYNVNDREKITWFGKNSQRQLDPASHDIVVFTRANAFQTAAMEEREFTEVYLLIDDIKVDSDKRKTF